MPKSETKQKQSVHLSKWILKPLWKDRNKTKGIAAFTELVLKL